MQPYMRKKRSSELEVTKGRIGLTSWNDTSREAGRSNRQGKGLNIFETKVKET